jgi:mannose-6-phosphate isomerase-like protein (cupin superfamily)
MLGTRRRHRRLRRLPRRSPREAPQGLLASGRAARLRPLTGELLHITEHETVLVIEETADELRVEGTWTPGGRPPPSHLHPVQDEHFEVRGGQLVVVVAGREHRLGPGATLDIPAGTPHTVHNAGDGVTSALWSTRPAGRTASWLRTLDRLGDRGRRTPPLPVIAEAVLEHPDVFQLAVGPRQLWPVIPMLLRGISVIGRAAKR